jgi:hypothetical protein
MQRYVIQRLHISQHAVTPANAPKCSTQTVLPRYSWLLYVLAIVHQVSHLFQSSYDMECGCSGDK